MILGVIQSFINALSLCKRKSCNFDQDSSQMQKCVSASLNLQLNVYCEISNPHYSFHSDNIISQLYTAFVAFCDRLCPSQCHIYQESCEIIRHLSVQKRTILQTWYTSYFFLETKLFCLSRQKVEIFSSLFDLGFRENLQNVSSFRQHSDDIFYQGNKTCPNELKICEVS